MRSCHYSQGSIDKGKADDNSMSENIAVTLYFSRVGHQHQDFFNLANESLVKVIKPIQTARLIDKALPYALKQTIKTVVKVAVEV